MRARLLLLTAAMAVVTLSGCHGSTRPTSSGVTNLGTVSPSAVPPAIPMSPTPTYTSGSPGVAACAAGDLAVNQLPGESGAAGTIAIGVEVTNASAVTCAVRGYPTFTLSVSSGGTDIVKTVKLLHGNFAGSIFGAAVTTISLAPGGHAGFGLAYLQIHIDGTGDCDIANKLRLTVPGSTTETVGPVRIPVCGEPMQISPYIPISKLKF